MTLKDKIVVVTGGSGLLGSAILGEIRKQGGIAVNADLKNDASGDDTFLCDINDEPSVTALVNAVFSKYGRIDGWVNNAYPRTADWGDRFESQSFDSWRTNVDMHLNGYALCCRIACEAMKKQGGGAIVNMASIYGVVGPDFNVYSGTDITNPAAYAAIKGGIINFTKYIASYYGPGKVRINCVSPGGIFAKQNPVFVKNYEQKTPLRRMGTPADIAPSVVFLLSDAANYITGHNLVVDGGWTII